MAAGENFKATIICQGDDGTSYVFDYGFTDTDGAVHLDTGIAAGDFQTLVQAKLVACLTDDVQVKSYRFACVKSPTHLGEIGYVTGVNVPGTRTSAERMPNEICICLKRSTGHASRRDRGRIFFGPVDQNFVNPDNVNKVVDDNRDLEDLRDTLKATFATQTAGLFPVILNAAGEYSGNIVNHTGIAEVFCHRRSRRPRTGV